MSLIIAKPVRIQMIATSNRLQENRFLQPSHLNRYRRRSHPNLKNPRSLKNPLSPKTRRNRPSLHNRGREMTCLLYTSDAADE